MKRETALIIFMKAPRLGRVKTRLQPQLTPELSLELHRAMGEDLVNRLRESEHFDLLIRFFPPQAEVEMRVWLGDDLRYAPQEGVNLGSKLQHAFSAMFVEGYRKVCIIGSDLPTLQQNDILGAFKKLDAADVVLGPATDGGYYLVALRENHPELFENIDWSTGLVLQQTLEKAREKRLSVAQMERREDMDTYQDILGLWKRMERDADQLTGSIPATIQILKKIFVK